MSVPSVSANTIERIQRVGINRQRTMLVLAECGRDLWILMQYAHNPVTIYTQDKSA